MDTRIVPAFLVLRQLTAKEMLDAASIAEEQKLA